jgi:hypothetical protein
VRERESRYVKERERERERQRQREREREDKTQTTLNKTSFLREPFYKID